MNAPDSWSSSWMNLSMAMSFSYKLNVWSTRPDLSQNDPTFPRLVAVDTIKILNLNLYAVDQTGDGVCDHRCISNTEWGWHPDEWHPTRSSNRFMWHRSTTKISAGAPDVYILASSMTPLTLCRLETQWRYVIVFPTCKVLTCKMVLLECRNNMKAD